MRMRLFMAPACPTSSPPAAIPRTATTSTITTPRRRAALSRPSPLAPRRPTARPTGTGGPSLRSARAALRKRDPCRPRSAHRTFGVRLVAAARRSAGKARTLPGTRRGPFGSRGLHPAPVLLLPAAHLGLGHPGLDAEEGVSVSTAARADTPRLFRPASPPDRSGPVRPRRVVPDTTRGPRPG